MIDQKGYKRMETKVDNPYHLASYNENCSAKVEYFSIQNSIKEKLIDVKFDSHLSFQNLISSFLQQ